MKMCFRYFFFFWQNRPAKVCGGTRRWNVITAQPRGDLDDHPTLLAFSQQKCRQVTKLIPIESYHKDA
jgi:hypothetical protein